MKLHRNWEFWIKYWKVDGKACQQKKPAGSEVCLQVNEKKKKICETQKKYKKASSGSCCGRCFFGILIVAGIEYGCNIQEKNMGNLQNSYVKLDKVSKIYKMGEVEIRAVDNISFEISKGEFVVVVGPSGAGKTTVLNILGGMDTATEGDVYVDGSNIAEYNLSLIHI